jgi:hypothetical protein
MSSADRSQYAEAVTRLSEGELMDVLSASEPPVCLLGGWAVEIALQFLEEQICDCWRHIKITIPVASEYWVLAGPIAEGEH